VRVVAIRKALPTDLTRMCVAAWRAFVDDPVMRFLFPDDDEYMAENGRVMRFPMRRWMHWDEVWTTADCVAVACWVPPSPGEIAIVREDADGPFPNEPDRLERFRAIGEAIAAQTPPEPHWYLNLIGTHPDWQRQGVGSALIRHQFERADADGLPCYLETETVENVAYYRHLGFEVTGEWAVDHPAGPRMWGMRRDPAA
jgi:GNAT superfamily N-acetyltransferase